MKGIVGLGNPGSEYAQTRHNVGFMVVDRLSSRWKIPLKQQLQHGVAGEGADDSNAVGLAMPVTFMNRSGQAVQELIQLWKLELADLLVVYDDVALPLGKIRIRADGSAGGHKGLGDILQRVGTEAVPRLRIGIGGEEIQGDLSDHVLTPFTKAEKTLLDDCLGQAVQACEVWIRQGTAAAMNQFNAGT